MGVAAEKHMENLVSTVFLWILILYVKGHLYTKQDMQVGLLRERLTLIIAILLQTAYTNYLITIFKMNLKPIGKAMTILIT